MGIFAHGVSGAPVTLGKPFPNNRLKQKTAVQPANGPFYAKPAQASLKTGKAQASPKAETDRQAKPYPPKAGPLLAIIDDYQTGLIPAFVKKPTPSSKLLLEAPTNGLASHGHVVEAHAKITSPNIRIERIQAPLKKNWGKQETDIVEALQILNRRLETDKSIDAINLSFGLALPIERIQQDLNLPELNAQNIHRHRERILKEFDQIQFSPPLLGIKGLHLWGEGQKKYIQKAMALLSEIARKKPVFVSAGNAGKDNINVLSLVKGVHSVGAGGIKPGLADYSADNSLIRHWAKATKRFIPIKNEQGQLMGLTLDDINHPKKGSRNHGQEVLIPLNALKMRPCGQGKWVNGLERAGIMNSVLSGTSFTSSQVAAQKAQQIHRNRKLFGFTPQNKPAQLPE
ncbi:hypothetical protein [Vampirovibrio sp.]|uniref:hypothetical protein n=1 Tax=Vampirovibrio sp. TaxID=2717857 RepID=UPI00359320F2